MGAGRERREAGCMVMVFPVPAGCRTGGVSGVEGRGLALARGWSPATN